MKTRAIVAVTAVLMIALAGCAAPAVPVQTVTPTEPAVEPPVGVGTIPSDEEIAAALATPLDVAADQISVVSVEPVDWPDACLGVYTPDVMCLQVITPGYRIVVDANGQQVEVHTNQDLSVVVEAGPEEPPSGASTVPSDEEVIKVLADKLGVSADQVSVVSVEPVDWPNSCLGVDTMEVMCAEVITPGYRIIADINGQQVELHSNEDLSVVLPVELFTPEPPSGAAAPASYDPADIYAAVIRQVYTVDHTFGQPPNFPIIYLVRTTDDSVGASGAPANGQTIAPADQERISAALTDLPAEFVWVDSADDVPRDAQGAVADRGAIITVGNITPQADGALHVPASIYIAMLAAGGQTYVLENAGNGWEITGTTGPIWIS
ncbi:MAG: hypothetical protein R2844_01045 [Caldilineales bacterium]